MDIKYINPFLQAIERVLAQFGISNIRLGNIQRKEAMHVEMETTAIIGIIGDVRGNVAYSFSEETARKIVSVMMGMSFTEMNALGRSGIGELANITAGTAASILASDSKLVCDITPPSVISGKNLYFIISSVVTIEVEIKTNFGRIIVNIGLEM